MYVAFRDHHMLPSIYNNLPIGEKQIFNAFVSYEIDERKEEIESVEGN